MSKKVFTLLMISILAAFAVVYAIRYYQPKSDYISDFSDFPLQKDGWTGQQEEVKDWIIDILKPENIFTATYVNTDGTSLNILFDYFTEGGAHSPRNCLPGSGWILAESQPRLIEFRGRTINAKRFLIRFQQTVKWMDFWYITRYGETAGDIEYKLYTLLSSLTFQPNDGAFVRIVCRGDDIGASALDDFESKFIPEIYDRLPFE